MATVDATDARLSTHEEMRRTLMNFLHYDCETGEFTCIKQSGKRLVGSKVGTISDGYLLIGFGKYRDRAHRLAWLYSYGYMPKEIDHINGNRMDNKLCNLREVTHKENTQNQVHLRKNNTSGFAGVSFFKGTKKYSAYICFDGKKRHLGYFDDPKEAHFVYLSEKRKYFNAEPKNDYRN